MERSDDKSRRASPVGNPQGPHRADTASRLAQISNDAADNRRTPLAIFDSLNVKDGDISVRLKPVGGREDPGAAWSGATGTKTTIMWPVPMR